MSPTLYGHSFYACWMRIFPVCLVWHLFGALKADGRNFKNFFFDIDYKQVASPEHSENYLSEILNESNVHLFAKSANDMPKKGGVFYEPSNVYRLWTQKYFFEGSSSNNKVPSTKTEWIHRYESCSDMLQRLDSGDVLAMIDHIIFSDKALEKMTIDCRSDIVKRILKFCRGKSSKHKNNLVLSTQWSNAASVLNSFHQHLQRLEEETLVHMRDSYDPKVRDYCKEFDMSKSSIQKLQSLLTRIVLEGPDLDLLKTFISCCPAEIEWEPADAYFKAIDAILFNIKHPHEPTFKCLNAMPPIEVLEEILKDITKEQEELMIEDAAAERLNEFCQDSGVSVSIRLGILQLLERTNCIAPEYCDLLLLYRTQAVVSSTWPELQVSEEEVKDDFQRKILFNSLLSLCQTVEHFSSLAKLLTQWPTFSQEETALNFHDELWTKLLSGLASLSNKDALTITVAIFDKALECPTFGFECCQEVFRRIKEQNSILHILKYALKTKYETLHSEAIQVLQDIKEITTEDYDSELLELILKRKVTALLVTTDLYKPVIEYLLHCQDDNNLEPHKSLDSVVKDLHNAGLDFEAGSLLIIKDSVHPSLGTFSAAISVLQRWLVSDSR